MLGVHRKVEEGFALDDAVVLYALDDQVELDGRHLVAGREGYVDPSGEADLVRGRVDGGDPLADSFAGSIGHFEDTAGIQAKDGVEDDGRIALCHVVRDGCFELGGPADPDAQLVAPLALVPGVDAQQRHLPDDRRPGGVDELRGRGEDREVGDDVSNDVELPGGARPDPYDAIFSYPGSVGEGGDGGASRRVGVDCRSGSRVGERDAMHDGGRGGVVEEEAGLDDVGGAVLVVSQFTLYGRRRCGPRPRAARRSRW